MAAPRGSQADIATAHIVALGVLLDTLVVRSVLVTALTLDIGRHMWWPSRLASPAGRRHRGHATRRADPRPVTGAARPVTCPRPRGGSGLPAGGAGLTGTYS